MKSFPVYSEKYEVYLVEVEDKVYRIQIYWQIKEVLKLHSETPKKRSKVKHIIVLKDVYVEQVFKYGGEKQ